jgi:septal ring factor EnvC (AmiA/AmiB activator)
MRIQPIPQSRFATGGSILPQRSLAERFSLPIVAFFIICTLLSGCENPEKIRLKSRIDELNEQKRTLLQTTASQQNDLDSLNDTLNERQAGLNEYQAQVRGYMLEHKMAIAAIVAGVGGADVALDTTNTFSDDAKNIAGPVVLLAAVWAAANFNEVTEVVKTLDEADAHVRTLQTQIANTTAAIERKQQTLQASRNQLAELTKQLTDLNTQLAAL